MFRDLKKVTIIDRIDLDEKWVECKVIYVWTLFIKNVVWVIYIKIAFIGVNYQKKSHHATHYNVGW